MEGVDEKDWAGGNAGGMQLFSSSWGCRDDLGIKEAGE
jgi:hypothetical protein